MSNNEDNMSTTPQLTSRDVTVLAFAFQSLKDASALQVSSDTFSNITTTS